MSSLQFRLKRDRILLNLLFAVAIFLAFVGLFTVFAILVQLATFIFDLIGLGVGHGGT